MAWTTACTSHLSALLNVLHMPVYWMKIYIYSKWLLFTTNMECLLRGTNWKLKFKLFLVLRPSYVIRRLMVISLRTNTVLIVQGRQGITWRDDELIVVRLSFIVNCYYFQIHTSDSDDMLHIYRVFRLNKRYEIFTYPSVSSGHENRIMSHHTYLKLKQQCSLLKVANPVFEGSELPSCTSEENNRLSWLHTILLNCKKSHDSVKLNITPHTTCKEMERKICNFNVRTTCHINRTHVQGNT